MDDANREELFRLNQLKTYWTCRTAMNLNAKKLQDGTTSCPSEFDGVGCWNETSAGQSALIPCPKFLPQANTSQQVTRRCSLEGKWIDESNSSVYSQCSAHLSQDALSDPLTHKLLTDFSRLENSPYEDPKFSRVFDDCLSNVLSRSPVIKGTYCTRTFDGWGCWNDTPADQTAFTPCPSFIGFSPERFAHKVCSTDGTWFTHPDTNRTWSNYTTCVDEEDLQFRQKMTILYIVGYSISAVTLMISLLIFFYFKSLQCTRIRVHKNLFLSFVMNNIMWILWYTYVVQDPEVLRRNNASCQTLHILVHYFLMCNYMWMFCEGLHLHLLMVVAFVQDVEVLKWFHVIGWGVPVLFIAIYSIARGKHPDQTAYCWIEDSPYMWIINGPVCLSMMMNLLFLVNIVRVLVTKMRALNSRETHQTRKAVRATLILLPLLGLHYFVIPFRPAIKTTAETVYEIISAIVTSFQGFSVGLLFCFLNGEVISQVKKLLTRQRLISGRDRRISTYATATLSFAITIEKYFKILFSLLCLHFGLPAGNYCCITGSSARWKIVEGHRLFISQVVVLMLYVL